MNHEIIRRAHRILCLSILAALVVWAQSKNSSPAIQSVTCPTQVLVGAPAVNCTITLTKAAPKGGLVVVDSAAPVTFSLTYPVTSTVKVYPSTTPTATTTTVTKSVSVIVSSPVTVPAGKTSTSFQVRAQ